MKAVHCAAVDLGAAGGRVLLGTWLGHRLVHREVHRFPNQFRGLAGHDYWNLPQLWAEVQTGLQQAVAALPAGGRLASVGIDTWGVDHVLVNDSGRPVFPVHAYRDGRTQAGHRRLRGAALARIYEATGQPNLSYNTSLQLQETLAVNPTLARVASRCLLLPDYFNFLLSGRMENELSIASTTQLLDVRAPRWSRPALAHFGVPAHWFSEPLPSPHRLGSVRGLPALAGAVATAVPGHDTACAFDAMPAYADGTDLYLSSGTWSLVGFESDAPLLGAPALRAGINNERLGSGRYRPLINCPGLWLLDQTLLSFGTVPAADEDWNSLLLAAEQAPATEPLLDVAAPDLFHPADMRAAIDAQLRKLRTPRPRHLAGYVRLICDSLGHAHAMAMRTFEQLSGRKFRHILMVGAGSRNRLLCKATADAAGVPVISFQLEGSAIGNLANQFIALGAVPDRHTFRQELVHNLRQTVYLPCF